MNLLKVMLLLMFIVGGALGLSAQEVGEPTDLIDFIVNFDTYTASMAGLAAVSIWLTGLINGLIKEAKSWVKQVVSWVVPTVFALVITYLLKVGFLVESSIWEVLIFGLGAGLVSNGIFDIGFVKAAVNWLVGKIFKKKEEVGG